MKIALLSYSHYGRSMAHTTEALGHEIVGAMDVEHSLR